MCLNLEMTSVGFFVFVVLFPFVLLLVCIFLMAFQLSPKSFIFNKKGDFPTLLFSIKKTQNNQSPPTKSFAALFWKYLI